MAIINLFLLSPIVEYFIKVVGILILAMVLGLYPFLFLKNAAVATMYVGQVCTNYCKRLSRISFCSIQLSDFSMLI